MQNASQQQPLFDCPHCGEPNYSTAKTCRKCSKPMSFLDPIIMSCAACWEKNSVYGPLTTATQVNCSKCGHALVRHGFHVVNNDPNSLYHLSSLKESPVNALQAQRNGKSPLPMDERGLMYANGKCVKCGNTEDQYTKFCRNCGARLQADDSASWLPSKTIVYYLYCPNCGEENEAPAKFCMQCGGGIPLSGQETLRKRRQEGFRGYGQPHQTIEKPERCITIGHSVSSQYSTWAFLQRGYSYEQSWDYLKEYQSNIDVGCWYVLQYQNRCPDCHAPFSITDSSTCLMCGWHHCPCCGEANKGTTQYCVYCGVLQINRHHVKSEGDTTCAIGYRRPRGDFAFYDVQRDYRIGLIFTLPLLYVPQVSIGKKPYSRIQQSFPKYEEQKPMKVTQEKQIKTWQFLLEHVSLGDMLSICINRQQALAYQVNLFRVTNTGIVGGLCECFTYSDGIGKNWGVIEFSRIGLFDLDALVREDVGDTEQEEQGAQQNTDLREERQKAEDTKIAMDMQRLMEEREERMEIDADTALFTEVRTIVKTRSLVGQLRNLIDENREQRA